MGVDPPRVVDVVALVGERLHQPDVLVEPVALLIVGAAAAADAAIVVPPVLQKIRIDFFSLCRTMSAYALPQSRALLGGVTNDQTGLEGRYTMELDYPFSQRPADPTAAPDFAGPSLSTAIREQWGLRLVPGKGPFQVLVVESAQPPTTD